MRLVAEATAALHSNGNAFAQSTEFEHADGRLVVGAAAAHLHDAGTSGAATEFDHMVTGGRHTIRMKSRTLQVLKQCRLKADLLLLKQQHAIVVRTQMLQQLQPE